MQRNGFNYAVESITRWSSYFMHKRDWEGKWVFIDMIKGGLLALLTRFDNGVFNEGGGLRFQLHVYRANNQTRNKYTCNAQTHDQCCNVMFMVAMCWQFHLKEVDCKVICKFTSNLNSNELHMQICLCSPNLNWSNMKTKSIFRILAFFDNFSYIICSIWS